MKKFFDKQRECLVYVNKEADEQYWDKLWESEKKKVVYDKTTKVLNNFICKETQIHLPQGSVILEGGCGLAVNSLNLLKLGYKPIALDYAPETTNFLKEKLPELDSRCGDVRDLDLENNSLDGYWSLGVIEHFYDGYTQILDEMTRVIRPDGFLFLTFPHMSVLRKLKSKLGFYPNWQENETNLKDFYQFALNENYVISDLVEKGFEVVSVKHEDGFKGLKDELIFGQNLFQNIYESNNIFAKAVKFFVQKVLSRLTSHIILITLKKKA